MDKLEKNKQHRQQMHAAIVRAVETKLATADRFGMTDAAAILKACLDALKSPEVQP